MRTSRSISVVIVLGLHLAVIALLLRETRSPAAMLDAANAPVELMYLPPTRIPKVRADTLRPKHLGVDVGVSIAPPAPDAFAAAAPASAPGDDGPGVNWAAEARRAVKAFEIRRDQHVMHSMIGSSAWEGWLPGRTHHAGDRFRTNSGDWIVWLDANCYQVASWYGGAPAPEAKKPETICTGDTRAPPTGPLD